MGWLSGALAVANPVGLFANMAAGGGQAYLNYRGAKKQIEAEQAMAAQNVALQREFAQKGIQWRAADAQKAGISPLAALGAQTHQFQPQHIGSSAGAKEQALGDALGSMGQNISRAMASSMTREQKRGMELDNSIKEQKLIALQDQNNLPLAQRSNSQKRTMNQPGNARMPNVEHRPSLITGQHSEKYPHIQSGAIPDTGYARTETGLHPIPSSDVKERIEDQFIPETAWAARNYLTPNATGGNKPPKSMWKKEFPGAEDMEWSLMKQEWQPVYGRKAQKPWSNEYKFLDKLLKGSSPVYKIYKSLTNKSKYKGKHNMGRYSQ
jgi:hypothetical protein